tara:strand:+ start:139 stop:1299 length:1161 start_codon:yes stop_codon:yes gene_type:complete
MGMQQGTWQDPESAWYRQPVAEDAPWWAQMAGSDPLMSIPGAQALRGAGQQLMGERAGRALTGLGQLFMPGAMASQNIRQGDYGAAGVDMGLDMLPLGGLAARGLRGGRRFVGETANNLGNINWSRFNFPNVTKYGPVVETNVPGDFARGIPSTSVNRTMGAEFTNPYILPGSPNDRNQIGRFVVGARPQGGGETRLFATDASGMNFRPMDWFNKRGGPVRQPGAVDFGYPGGPSGTGLTPTNYGGSMMPGDQEFMNFLNQKYTFPTGELPPFSSSIPNPIESGNLRRRAQTAAEGIPTTPAALNRMIGLPSGVPSPPSEIRMGKPMQALTGGNLGMAPAVARTARGDMEEQFQQQPDLAGQLRRNVRARGGTTGRRGRGTGDTGG